MADLDYSFEKVITGTVGGLLIGFFYVTLVNLGILPEFVFQLIKLASIGVWFSLIASISSWSLGYLLGWGVGIYVVHSAGLVSDIDLILCALIALLGLWVHFTSKQYPDY